MKSILLMVACLLLVVSVPCFAAEDAADMDGSNDVQLLTGVMTVSPTLDTADVYIPTDAELLEAAQAQE